MLGLFKASIFVPLLVATSVFVTSCSSDGSSLATRQAQQRLTRALTTINPIIREHNSASDRAMDLLVDLKQLRSVDTSWTQNHRRNLLSGGLMTLTTTPNLLEYIWETTWEPWQKDQRDDLRVEADQIKSILGQLHISRTRLSNASANVPEFQRFGQTGLPAIDRQIRIIDDINGWYLEFMTQDAGESFTPELITMLDVAPTRFLDARLRWDSAKSDLPR